MNLRSSSLLCLTLAACGSPANREASRPRIPQNAVRTERAPVSGADLQSTAEVQKLGEEIPTSGFRIWLSKEFWLNRKIFVSYGIERSSRSSLAGSVMGYVAATVVRHGNELALERDMTKLSASTTLVPEVVLNAYPIVSESETEILVDFASARAPYGIAAADIVASSSGSAAATPLLDVLKDFRVGDESLTFFNLMSLRTEQPLFDSSDESAEAHTGQDPNLLALTLRTDWVLQRETPAFSPIAADDSILGFFLSDPLVSENGGSTQQFVDHIDLSKPFTWTLPTSIPAEYASFAAEGITAWNQVFDRPALAVKTDAKALESISDPTRSTLIWDDNRATTAAFANWRSNPYTGEIVQAQVYMPGEMWAEQAEFLYKLRELERRLRRAANASPAPAPVAAFASVRRELKDLAAQAREINERNRQTPRVVFFAPSPSLAAEKIRARNWCYRQADISVAARTQLLTAMAGGPLAGAPEGNPTPDPGPAPGPVTPPKLEDIEHHLPYPTVGTTIDAFKQHIVRSVIMHEVGHTLGLRHNFMASTTPSSVDGMAGPRSGSIMDYNDLVIDGDFTGPGATDRLIVRSLYYGEAPAKAPRFCTDEDAMSGQPDCQPFDAFNDPVRFRQVSEETDLLIGLHFANMGSVDVGLQLLNRGLQSVLEQAAFALYPTFEATILVSDPNFGDRQHSAWDGLAKSRAMRGIEWPEELKAQYSEMVVQAVAAAANTQAKDSVVYEDAVKMLSNAVTDEGGEMAVETRLAAVKGLKGFQDLRARAALTVARKALETRAATDPLSETAQKDDEVLSTVRKLLENGYFDTTAAN